MSSRMSHPRSGRDEAPPALHNSGPVPREVYRTAAVGQLFQLDLGVLLGGSGLPEELQRPMRCGPHVPNGPLPEHYVPAHKAHAIAHFLLTELVPSKAERASQSRDDYKAHHDAPPGGRHDDSGVQARAAIAALAARLTELGWLAPFYGLATPAWVSNPRHMAREQTGWNTEWPWLPAGEQHRVLRLAWCVCAISHLSPPLILWTRPPSLAWWRGDEVISLRWFGQSHHAVNTGVRS